MTTPIIQKRKALVLSCLVLSLVLPAYGRVQEGVDTLVNFTGPNGAQPQSIIEDSAGNFYGTTLAGGKYNKGIVYEVTQTGKLLTLVDFKGEDGASPEAGLLLGPDGSLYGTTKRGGAHDKGTVFRISSDGKFSTLVSFTGANGAQPDSGLFMGPDGTIYGSTLTGGSDDKGIVFKITPAGKLDTIVSFNGANGANPGSLARSDDGTLYGTCNKGGKGKGLVFKLSPTGQLTTLVSFEGPNGAFPVSGIVMSDEKELYGTTSDGGKDNFGTVYKFSADGKFSTLAAFKGMNGSHPDSGLIQWSNGYFYMIRLWQNTRVKAAYPQWAGNNFCGTTATGGVHGKGTVFRVGDDGNLVTLVSFTGTEGIDLGANPNSIIPGEDGNLYGTTGFGGTNSQGTIWRLQLQLWPLPIAGSTTGSDAGSVNLKPPIVSK